MTTCIVLAPTTFERRFMEDSEDKIFDTLEDAVEHFLPAEVLIYTLSEFMDLCNNEEIELSISWITYVHIGIM